MIKVLGKTRKISPRLSRAKDTLIQKLIPKLPPRIKPLHQLPKLPSRGYRRWICSGDIVKSLPQCGAGPQSCNCFSISGSML